MGQRQDSRSCNNSVGARSHMGTEEGNRKGRKEEPRRTQRKAADAKRDREGRKKDPLNRLMVPRAHGRGDVNQQVARAVEVERHRGRNGRGGAVLRDDGRAGICFPGREGRSVVDMRRYSLAVEDDGTLLNWCASARARHLFSLWSAVYNMSLRRAENASQAQGYEFNLTFRMAIPVTLGMGLVKVTNEVSGEGNGKLVSLAAIPGIDVALLVDCARPTFCPKILARGFRQALDLTIEFWKRKVVGGAPEHGAGIVLDDVADQDAEGGERSGHGWDNHAAGAQAL